MKLAIKNIINDTKTALLIMESGLKDIEIYLDRDGSDMKYDRYLPALYHLMDREEDFTVWLFGFPYCLISAEARDHVLPDKNNIGVKADKCKICRYYKVCSGYPEAYLQKFGNQVISPIPDIPVEVMLEIESGCNYKCEFCYNKNSFAKKGRTVARLGRTKVKEVLDEASELGVPVIRFTGGEPMLHPELNNYLSLAKERGFEVRLNTNCSLFNNSNINIVASFVDNILIPIEDHREEREYQITGFSQSLKNKIKAIKNLKTLGVKVVRVGSVLGSELIDNFEGLAEMVLGLPVDEWEFYRPISQPGISRKIKEKDLEIFIGKIITLKRLTNISLSIANALPFCSIRDRLAINSISRGAIFDDGHSRLVADPRSFFKPHYFIDYNLGDLGSIRQAWRHPFMKNMRGLKYLPEACHGCRFAFKCKGGSRHEAVLSTGTIKGNDPMFKYGPYN